MASIPKMAICLWFDSQAEDAVDFYTSIFKNSKIIKTLHFGEAGYEIHQRPAGSIMTIEFELNGQLFTALNGGPHFKFNEAISIEVHCESQAELDHYWDNLSEGGPKEAQQCGWLKDKYGLSWQIVPNILSDFMNDKNYAKTERVMSAMLQMKKLDFAALEKAFNG